MDSWTLQGDSYSFLRSAPRTYSLCHRDGTPNHVEIFDIINVPTQRSAISETTCLCDIFGDDCESPSQSSSPAVGPFVPSQREVDGTAAATPLLDDLNDSSGSYHTAPGSIEGEEGFEDSKERLQSPLSQNSSSEWWQSEGEREISEDTNPYLEQQSKSPAPLPRSLPSDDLDTGERPSSLGQNSSISPEERVSPLSSSSFEKRQSSSSSPNPHPEAEPERLIPVWKGKHNSPSHQLLAPSPHSERTPCASPSSSESVNTLSPDIVREEQNSPEPGSSHSHQHSSPSPESTPKDISIGFTESTVESGASISTLLPVEQSLCHSRETLVSPELKTRPYSPNTQSSSPFPEPRGRVSLPDLFSRGSTPGVEEPTSSPGLISNPTGGRDTTTTPENQNTSFSVETGSAVSTPAPRYTPPSPVISLTTSQELVEGSISPELRHATRSPDLLSAAPLVKTGIRTLSPCPSPKKSSSAPSENRSQVSSPAVSYSLSPSPGSNRSPFEHRHTASSPEIRITASSPEPYSDSASASSRSLTSSPHITGFSYTVVQPEDRDTPPFPELSHPSIQEPDSTLASSEARSPTQSRNSKHSSIAESTGTPRDSPISGFTSSVLQPEITPYQARYQTPSPQTKFHTPSPESRHQTPTSLSESPPHLTPSRDLVPVSPSPEHNLSPIVLTRLCPQHTQCTPPLSVTPEVERFSSSVDFKETEYSAHLEKEVSPSSELDIGNNSVPAEIKSISPVAAVQSPLFDFPFVAEEEIAGSRKQQSTEIEAPHKEVNIQDKSKLVSFSEEKQEFGCTFLQKAESYYNLPVEIRSPSSNFQGSKDGGLISSPVHRATSDSPTSESSGSLKSACTPEQSERHLTDKVSCENRERITENMSHYTNRRRTPSPPLTRFTPVHIIAPEKPYRQWQNRSRSPSQVVASSPSANLKTASTNRESPHAAPVDNNGQAHSVRQGRRQEVDREMRLERERGVIKQRQRNREMETERSREERVPEKGEGWHGNASYRGEQIELSFNARNRKGPASRSAAPTSRETRQGLPTLHSYSESLLARQLQQQQGLLRLASQQDTRGGGPSRRLQPPTQQNRNSALGRVAASRPCRSSSSSMGSELDEADNEVKWFTDLAFRSLSSPEVDYLDMYNSSHRSSTNISQPSTQESPAGVNPAWQAYADFRGSASKLDNDELSFQQSSAYYSDDLDPSRRYEMGSFECVDVAVEREDSRKVRRGVPKRQIQLKRKDNTEGKQDESSDNSSPGIPVMMESPSQESHNIETFMRQHSVANSAAIQDCYSAESSPGSNQKNEGKFSLERSVSTEETCTKAKIATCLIQSVLSKKMQSVDKPDEQVEAVSPAFEEKSPPSQSAEITPEVFPKPDRHNLSPTLKSDHGLSSEKPVSGDPSATDEAKSANHIRVRSSYRPSSSSSSRSVSFSQTDSEEADSQNATSRRLEMRSELKVPFENSKQSRSGVPRVDGIKSWDEKECGDSANATAGNFAAPSATGDSSMRERMTNSDQECENTEDHKQLLQGERVACTSKPQEITLKAVEKKKASLNVCLTPEAENKLQPSSPDLFLSEREERVKTSVDEKTGEDEEHCNNKVKTPIHKVRDVRQLVKNTYNLSFKAPSPVIPSDMKTENFNERTEEVQDEREEVVMTEKEEEIRMQQRREEREGHGVEKEEEQKAEVKDSNLLNLSMPPQSARKPLSCQQPIQIEYKAVCWKEDKNKTSCSKRENTDKPRASPDLVAEVSRELRKSTNTQNYTTEVTAIDKPCQQDLKKAAETHETVTEKHKMADKDVEPVVVTTDRKPPMLGSLPKLSSKEREVSTAVVLIRDGSSKTMTSASPAPEEIPTPVQFPTAPLSPGPTTPGGAPRGSGHSVSMLLKEKGYQADIGAVVGDDPNAAGGKGPPRKHVNCLEIPLQTTMVSDGGRVESHRERTLSSSSTMSGPSVLENTDMLTKSTEAEESNIKPPMKDVAKQKSSPALRSTSEQTLPLNKPKEHGDFEAVKRLDPTFPPRSPAVRRFRPQPIAVKSLSKETQRQEMPANASGNNRPQTIEVKSIAKNSQKPVVPPKPTCKFIPTELGAMPNEAQRPSAATSTVKQQGEERSQTIVVSSPTIYRKISNESSSNYSRKLAVSAVSSVKPPPSKTSATTISSLSNQSAPSEAEAYGDGGQQPADSPHTSTYTQRPTTLGLTSTTCPSSTSAPRPVSDTTISQVNAPTATGVNQPIQPDVMDSASQPLHPRMGYSHEPPMPLTLNHTQQSAAVSKPQVPGYKHQACRRSLSNEHPQRTDGLRFYASDDPPSYDERESFSPLMLPDLTPRRSNRYQPSSRPPPCSCTASCPSHPGLTPHHHHRSPHSLTPPAPPHSPGQAIPYGVAQPSLRPHLCRPDTQPISYQPSSPKSSPLGPSQPPALYQPLHHPPPCPPHPSLMQACTADRPLQPPQHTDPRRPPVHRSPQQQPPTLTGAPYNDPGHSHSPGLPPMDPQYLCGSQSMGPSYGSEYGGDSSSLYSESNYGQTPRRVLLDPETGKYFYIEVPVQPLRKMLFDPETGQYVEVLIPQQAMSHSGLYPPSAAPYSALHNPNMYAPAPQYMPYAHPPPTTHAQPQPQPPRYPEASAEATMHPSGPGLRYRNHSGQASKPEPQNHPPLDQSYLESMYYVPTGMNASPNHTPPDYYHKHPPNLPPTGGKRS